MNAAEVLGDRYELGVRIGRGGMADVHLATDLLLQRSVAVKVLRDAAGDESDAARFAAEARTLAGLNHRGLVTVLDAGATAGRPFLVMELVDGPTLYTLIAQRALTPTRIADYGGQVAHALAYVHARGVLHRDVKPGNVLVGAGDRVKLADFGIARLIGDTVRHTSTGQTIGTAAYLAPEQVLGADLSPAVDVYALGLVLLEALTGERAFPGTPTEAAFARLKRAPAIPVSLPGDWSDLLRAMTDQDPTNRPSATEVADALHDVRRGTPATVSMPSSTDTAVRTIAVAPPARTTRFSRRTLTLLPAAALLVPAVVLTTTVGDATPPPEPTVVGTAPDEVVPSTPGATPPDATPPAQAAQPARATGPKQAKGPKKAKPPKKSKKPKGPGKAGRGPR